MTTDLKEMQIREVNSYVKRAMKNAESCDIKFKVKGSTKIVHMTIHVEKPETFTDSEGVVWKKVQG